MTEPARTFDLAGLKVSLHYDEDGEHCNPRDYDNVGTMLCAPHRHYELGDEQLPDDPNDLTIDCDRCEANGYVPHDGDDGHSRYEDGTMSCPKCGGDGTVPALVIDWARAQYNIIGPIIKLGLIDHSGLSMYVGGGSHMSDSQGFDSGTVGIIFATEESLKALMGEVDYKPADFAGTHDEWIEHVLTTEVEEYDRWLRGEVFGYTIENADGEELDSCWGLLGSEYAEQAAREAAETEAKHQAKLRDGRRDKLAELIETHGSGMGRHQIDLFNPDDRYALMESNGNVPPRWSMGADYTELLAASAKARQDDREHWPAVMLYDLNTGEGKPVRLTYTIEPAASEE